MLCTDYFMEMPYNPPGCRNRTLGTLFQGRKSNLPTFIMGAEPIEALHTKSEFHLVGNKLEYLEM